MERPPVVHNRVCGSLCFTKLGDVSDMVRVAHGLWRPAGSITDLPGRVAALLSACPPGTVVGGLTAARLHGMWLPEDAGDHIELLLRADERAAEAHAGSRRTEFRGRRRRIARDEVTVVDGLPITTEARTWVDLGERLLPADLVSAGDSVLRTGVSPSELAEMARRAVHRRGIVRVRSVLPHLDGRSRSRPESHARYALVVAGLPKPDVNEPIFDDRGQWLFEPDLAYRDVRLALEYNGTDHAEVGRMRRDITRAVDAGARGGWRTETFGPVEVFRRPNELAAYVAELRRERSRPWF